LCSFATMMYPLGILFGCLLPCACVPFCVDTCRDVKHYCPKCANYLGTYIRG